MNLDFSQQIHPIILLSLHLIIVSNAEQEEIESEIEEVEEELELDSEQKKKTCKN